MQVDVAGRVAALRGCDRGNCVAKGCEARWRQPVMTVAPMELATFSTSLRPGLLHG